MNPSDARDTIKTGTVEHKAAAFEHKMTGEHHRAQAEANWAAANDPNLPVGERIKAGTSAVLEKTKEGIDAAQSSIHNMRS